MNICSNYSGNKGFRLLNIYERMNKGERICKSELAESFNVSDAFTIATGEQYKYTFYKISTEPGAKYTINFCNYYNSSDFTNIPDDIELSSPNLYAFTTDGKQIGENSSNNTTLSFMADGTVTYIGFYDDWLIADWTVAI